MKIAVVRATGATGRRVVKHALAQGHFVTAVARHPARLSSADRLSLVRGDVLSPGGLTGALACGTLDPTAAKRSILFSRPCFAGRVEGRLFALAFPVRDAIAMQSITLQHLRATAPFDSPRGAGTANRQGSLRGGGNCMTWFSLRFP